MEFHSAEELGIGVNTLNINGNDRNLNVYKYEDFGVNTLNNNGNNK